MEKSSVCFSVSCRSDNRGSGIHSISIVVKLLQKCDAGRDIVDNIGRSYAAEYVDKARKLKDLTGGLVFFRAPGFEDNEISISWQSNDDKPDDWYAPHIGRMSFRAKSVELLRKLAKAADLENADSFYFKPRTMIAALQSIKAIPVKYASEISDYVQDEDFSVDSHFPIPAETVNA